ncbi:ribosome small subunit-dependent GTPase A [Verrucomicrobiota bacterium]
MELSELGWDSFFEEGFLQYKDDGLIPARTGREDRGQYLLFSAGGELTGEVSGRFRHEAGDKEEFPAVGDWVAADVLPAEHRATIHAVLPRRSGFVRKAPGGRTEGQIVAANVDTAFIVNGLDGGRNFNLRRTERYMALAWESGAEPVIVLNKADVCPDVEARVREAEAVASGVPVYPVSALTGQGLDLLHRHMVSGQTACFIGSSGVGKSALINSLLGTERQAVNTLRKGDLQGRHTTTRRELIVLPGKGIVIDTPGMRELQMWGDEDSVSHTFADIEELAARCRFRDCKHQGEPGCAVQLAIGQGSLDAGRFESYLRLQREMAHLARRQDNRARLAEKAKWKKIAQWSKEHYKERGP